MLLKSACGCMNGREHLRYMHSWTWGTQMLVPVSPGLRVNLRVFAENGDIDLFCFCFNVRSTASGPNIQDHQRRGHSRQLTQIRCCTTCTGVPLPSHHQGLEWSTRWLSDSKHSRHFCVKGALDKTQTPSTPPHPFFFFLFFLVSFTCRTSWKVAE